MMFTLSQFPLPYAYGALAPYMSPETLELHHGKHLATYIKNLNDLIENTPYESVELYEIIKSSAADKQNPNAQKIYNNAAQIFNHDFFFKGMCNDCNGQIPSEIANAFGSADEFKKQFKNAATSLFGSGYTWLVRDGEDLKIINMQNADTPIAYNMVPLLNLDVWEHAYYVDYQNRRADFIDNYLEHLVDWGQVAENLKQ
ncbi:MAG: superoxide dismutase [Alphaproteobacteria bacterium]|nr:superoxide dismutase [Alphaproteobacteria bacterium]